MNRSSLPAARLRRPLGRIGRGAAALSVAGALVLGAAACSSDDDGSDTTAASEDADATDSADGDSGSAGATGSDGRAFDSRLDPENNTAMLADGVSIPPGSTLFKTAGIGPDGLNTDAEETDPLAYVDPALLVDGELPDGMTPTEAQGLQVLAKIREQLQAEGLDVQDVATMRVFLAGDGDEKPDFAGWNRAYKQYFANTDLRTGDPQQLARGTSEEVSDPLVVNPTRPTRFAFGIAAMAVDGWLVEVEVDAYSAAE